MTDIAGWPHWEIQFDKAGSMDAAVRTVLLDQVAAADLTDLIIMSHGWNSSINRARQLYAQWFGMFPPLLPARSTARLGTAGVIWPAMLWPDDTLPAGAAPTDGGAAALPEPATVGGAAGAPVAALTAVYSDPGQQQILNQLAVLLNTQSPDPQALIQFHDLMRALGATESQAIDLEDSGPLAMLTEDPQTLAIRFAATLDTATAQVTTGVAATGGAGEAFNDDGAIDLPNVTLADTEQVAAAGIGDITTRLWNGAKEALRQFTYWQMKQRAGTVGRHGLGPFIDALTHRLPNLHVHLVGHSFGARLVAFSLSGLPGSQPSPVRSLTLLEGAFSHFAFAPTLPQDPARSGALNGMMARVNGPLLACYSSHDTAIGLFYPVASMTANDDAAGLTDDLMFRWGAIGHDGAQAVDATTMALQAPGTRYSFATCQFTNIDASAIVCHGRAPSGAHSDIMHAELGWAMLTAAGLA